MSRSVRVRPSWRTPPLQLLVLGLLAALPGLAFLRLLPLDRIVGPVLLAALVATVISGLQGSPGPRSLASRVGWSALAFVLVTSATVLRSTTWLLLPTPSSLRALQDALVNGVARLLSSAVPGPALSSSLVLPVALTWVVAFVSIEVAVRRRAALGPILPSAVAYGAVLLLGGHDALLGLTAVLVAAGALLGVLRSEAVGSGRRGRARRVGLGVIVAGGVAIVAVGIARVVPVGSEPFDLHDQVSSAPTDRPEISPLARMQGLLLDKTNPEMFEVHLPDADLDQAPNWRLAVLDQFDGSQWSTSGTALPAGTDLPPAPAASDAVPSEHPLHQQVTLKALDGSWIPAADRPSQISLPSVDVVPASGTLSLPDGARPDLTYSVLSQVPQLTPTDLDHATIDHSAQAGADELPPGSTAAVDDTTQRTGRVVKGHTDTPFQALTAIQTYLRAAPFTYKASAPSGQSYAQIADFLGRTHAGSAEQFAGAFCVMARSQQLPCRVAVGFRRGKPTSGTFKVRANDAYAWPEVPFRGLGWVAFDPTPRGGNAVAPSVADLVAPDSSSNTPTSDPNALGGDVTGSGAQGSTPPASSDTSGADLVVLLTAGALALLLLAPLTVVALKARRRRRRATASSPSARVLGAWQQVAEELDRPAAGASLTVGEVVTASTRQHGPELGAPLAELGSLTNLALFDRRGPTAQQSDLAWSYADEAARIAGAGRTRRARLLRRVDPRPLWRRPAGR